MSGKPPPPSRAARGQNVPEQDADFTAEAEYHEGYDEGYNQGYGEGYGEGYENYGEGYEEGYHEGYDESLAYSQAGQGVEAEAVPAAASAAAPAPAAATQSNAVTVRALYDYTPTNPGELAFKTGDMLTLVEEHESGWGTATLKDQRGMIPMNHVKKVEGHVGQKKASELKKKEEELQRELAQYESQLARAKAENKKVEEEIGRLMMKDEYCDYLYSLKKLVLLLEQESELAMELQVSTKILQEDMSVFRDFLNKEIKSKSPYEEQKKHVDEQMDKTMPQLKDDEQSMEETQRKKKEFMNILIKFQQRWQEVENAGK